MIGWLDGWHGMSGELPLWAMEDLRYVWVRMSLPSRIQHIAA